MGNSVHDETDETWCAQLRASNQRANRLFPTQEVRDRRDGKVYKVIGRGAFGNKNYELTVICPQDTSRRLIHILERDFLHFESVPA